MPLVPRWTLPSGTRYCRCEVLVADAEIGDVTRFPTTAARCCCAGLTPPHCESDKTVHRGHVNIAKVAAARKMLEVVYYALRDGQARCLTAAAEAADTGNDFVQAG